jgi:hypothetical protein
MAMAAQANETPTPPYGSVVTHLYRLDNFILAPAYFPPPQPAAENGPSGKDGHFGVRGGELSAVRWDGRHIGVMLTVLFRG